MTTQTTQDINTSINKINNPKRKTLYISVGLLVIFLGIALLLFLKLKSLTEDYNTSHYADSTAILPSDTGTGQIPVYYNGRSDGSGVVDKYKASGNKIEAKTNYFIKEESGWNYYENKEIGFTYKLPASKYFEVFEDLLILYHYDYSPMLRLYAETTPVDAMCRSALEISYPVIIEGPHYDDFTKDFENGLSGLNEIYDNSYYGTVDSRKALIYESDPVEPPEGFQGGYCPMYLKYVFIDMDDGSILTITSYWMEGWEGEMFNQVIDSIKFTDR